jgi:hypothetical protein
MKKFKYETDFYVGYVYAENIKKATIKALKQIIKDSDEKEFICIKFKIKIE